MEFLPASSKVWRVQSRLRLRAFDLTCLYAFSRLDPKLRRLCLICSISSASCGVIHGILGTTLMRLNVVFSTCQTSVNCCACSSRCPCGKLAVYSLLRQCCRRVGVVCCLPASHVPAIPFSCLRQCVGFLIVFFPTMSLYPSPGDFLCAVAGTCRYF